MFVGIYKHRWFDAGDGAADGNPSEKRTPEDALTWPVAGAADGEPSGLKASRRKTVTQEQPTEFHRVGYGSGTYQSPSGAADGEPSGEAARDQRAQ